MMSRGNGRGRTRGGKVVHTNSFPFAPVTKDVSTQLYIYICLYTFMQ